jgi:hypothetical protein
MRLKPRTEESTPAAEPVGEHDRWRLADLEAAQRRNLYAAGRGDGPRSASRRRWTLRRR